MWVVGRGVGENLTGSRSQGLTGGQVLYNNGNKGTPGTIISYALRTRYRLIKFPYLLSP